MIDTEKNERRDWTLLIFIIPIGIILIILVGQLAVRLVPFWRVSADMNSNLEPDPASARPFALLEPILPQILTPMAWAQSYLTPGAEISFPPFLTFEPTATPSPTAATSTETSETPTATATPPSPVPTGTSATPTPPSGGGGGGDGGGSPTAPTTCQDPIATNNGGPLPCTYPPTTCTDPVATNNGGPLPCTYPPTTCTDPAATNNGGPLPCTYPPTTCTDPAATNNGGPLPCTYPPTTCTDPLANNNGGPLPCVYPVVSTLDPGDQVTPVPSQIGVGTLPDNAGPGDQDVGYIIDGTYVVIGLSVTVNPTPDNNYDLVFYEYNYNNLGFINLDNIIIGISHLSDGTQYYEVFNWGDGTPDTNSNTGDAAQTTGTELDNQSIPTTELYDPDGAGTAPQTGILIDVDTAASNPPADTYEFVVVISPLSGTGQSAQVDSVQTVEVSTPTP